MRCPKFYRRQKERRGPAETSGGSRYRGLVSLALVNNEVGTITDMNRVVSIVQEANLKRGVGTDPIFVHTDAVQAPGHVHVDVSKTVLVDFLTLSAHKFHGPPGVGLVYIRDPKTLKPMLVGGGQQNGRRAGTENVPALIGMALAFRTVNEPTFLQKNWTHFRTAYILRETCQNKAGSVDLPI